MGAKVLCGIQQWSSCRQNAEQPAVAAGEARASTSPRRHEPRYKRLVSNTRGKERILSSQYGELIEKTTESGCCWISEEVFDGADNTLVLEKHISFTLNCQFNLNMYPFDSQRCTFVYYVTNGDDVCFKLVSLFFQYYFQNCVM